MYRGFKGKNGLRTRDIFKESNLYLWYVKYLSSKAMVLKEILPLQFLPERVSSCTRHFLVSLGSTQIKNSSFGLMGNVYFLFLLLIVVHYTHLLKMPGQIVMQWKLIASLFQWSRSSVSGDDWDQIYVPPETVRAESQDQKLCKEAMYKDFTGK